MLLAGTMILSAQSPTHTDTICLSKDQFVKVLTKAEQAKVYALQIEQFKIDTALLSYRIAQKQAIVDNLNAKEAINAKVVATYSDEIAIMMDQRKILGAEITNLHRLVKKSNRKIWWRTFIGAGLSAIFCYLYITK